ncbi:MAG: hypothetical protein HIU89_02635 [Proteobacteria bacterium]|nr:hypothetical protein [Pseudomonadota bacterium]
MAATTSSSPLPRAIATGACIRTTVFCGGGTVRRNQKWRKSRIVGPDKTLANDELRTPDGQVFDLMFSERRCQGRLEDHLLAARHALFQTIAKRYIAMICDRKWQR